MPHCENSYSNCTRHRRRLAFLLITFLLSLILQPYASAQQPELKANAADAAKLLNIQPQVEQLIALKQNSDSGNGSAEETRLQLLVVKKILGGSLDVRKATDLIDNQLASEYTAQGQMLASRNRGLELNNIANFSQNGIISLISGSLDLDGQHKVANEMCIVSGSTTLLLSSIALAQTRAGKRNFDAEPNMLAQVLTLDAPEEQRFSPLLWSYLNSVPTDSKDGMTRREHLIARWKHQGVLTVNLDKHENLEKLAVQEPAHKRRSETVKLVTNRIVMLHDVHTLVESLDRDLVDLLGAVD
jgi:hypothetical protein